MIKVALYGDDQLMSCGVVHAAIQEAIGEPVSIIIVVVARQLPRVRTLSLTIDSGDIKRRFFGVVQQIKVLPGEPHVYELTTVTPFFAYCNQTTKRRCFAQQSIASILDVIFKSYKRLQVDWSMCCRPAPLCAYEIQYDETDYQFIRRLMAFYGYSYRWDGQRMLIINDVGGYYMLGSSAVPYHYTLQCAWVGESCGVSADIPVSAAIDKNRYNLCENQYMPGQWSRSALQQRLSHVVERRLSQQYIASFASRSLGMQAGVVVDWDKSWVIDRVCHWVYVKDQICWYENHGDARLSQRFCALPAVLPPLEDAYQRAQVVAVESSRLCRVRIRYAWDTNQCASPWVPVSQRATGQQAGFQMMPCIGDWVQVGFLQGVMTCPVVMGWEPSAVSSIQIGHPLRWLSAQPGTLTFTTAGEMHIDAKQAVNIEAENDMILEVSGDTISTWTIQQLMSKATEDVILQVGQSRLTISQSGIVLSANKILLNSDDSDSG